MVDLSVDISVDQDLRTRAIAMKLSKQYNTEIKVDKEIINFGERFGYWVSIGEKFNIIAEGKMQRDINMHLPNEINEIIGMLRKGTLGQHATSEPGDIGYKAKYLLRQVDGDTLMFGV